MGLEKKLPRETISPLPPLNFSTFQYGVMPLLQCPLSRGRQSLRSTKQQAVGRLKGERSIFTSNKLKDSGAASNTDPDASRFEITSEER